MPFKLLKGKVYSYTANISHGAFWQYHVHIDSLTQGGTSEIKWTFAIGNKYFDSDNGQTIFLDGILMDIMVYDGEI